MCDCVEFTTLPLNKNAFYKVTGNGIIFSVKSGGGGGAACGLSKGYSVACNYWVFLAINGQTVLKNGSNSEVSKHTPDLLSDRVYRKFWLCWSNGIISLGKAGNPTPIITSRYNYDIEEIQYITFLSANSLIHWKVLFPPVLERPYNIRTLSVGKPEWVSAHDQLPDGSVIGGYENEFLYIIRAPHRGSLTPGKFVPSLGIGFISWGGRANEKNEFEVLCGIDYKWVKTTVDKIPVTAVEAGYSEGFDSEALYVGRAKHENFLIPGKVQPSHGVCYIAYDDLEIAKTEFEILTCYSINKYVNHKLFLRSTEPEYDSYESESELLDITD